MSKYKKFDHKLTTTIARCGFDKASLKIVLDISTDISKAIIRTEKQSEFIEWLQNYILDSPHVLQHPREFAYALTELMVKHQSQNIGKAITGMHVIEVNQNNMDDLPEVLKNFILKQKNENPPDEDNGDIN